MSNKVEITLLESINANDSAAVLSINNNFLALRDALNNTLSRDGTSPNYMDNVLDMNSYRIINTAEPTYDSDYVTLGWIKANYGDIASYTERAEAAANSAEAAYSNIRELATIVANDAQGVIDIINDFESETLTNYYTKSETNTLLNGKADVATTLSGYGITDGANTALSNLNSDGQMIIDSQNGTISNCVLEIPQNLKLTLENNVLTLASGSVVALTGYNTYTTRTTTANITKDSWASGWYNKTVLLYIGSTGTWFGFKEVSKVGSGSSLPVDNTNFDDFYLTTDYSLYEWENGTWSKKNFSYPLAIVNVDSNGVATFAKDSNGNDMIFNGAGFIGTALFCFPNVKGLIPNGLNANGTYKSEIMISNAVRITQLAAFNANRILLSNSLGGLGVLYDLTPELGGYDAKTNLIYRGSGTVISKQVELGEITMSSGIITNFTIRQPVRTATVEMLNSALGDIETLLAAI